MALKCLVFDCDGVILDSVPVKTRAFARLAEPYGEEARDRFVMYHTVHGGVSRYKKFEWFFREILDRKIPPAESEEWGRRFAEYALDEVRRCELIPGIARVLEHWQGKLPLYVCSGAPHEELNFILKERGLDSCFTGIYGSPPSKAKLLAMIVDKACLTRCSWWATPPRTAMPPKRWAPCSTAPGLISGAGIFPGGLI